MAAVTKKIPAKKPQDSVKGPDLPVKNLSDLTEAELLMTIYQQQDVVAGLRQRLMQEERRLQLIDTEGRKRAKLVETK